MVGSGCCINAATVLAVIDSCRKATAAAASTATRGAHARDYRKNRREYARGCANKFSNGPSYVSVIYLCISQGHLSRGCAHRVGLDRMSIAAIVRPADRPREKEGQRERLFFKGPGVFTVPRSRVSRSLCLSAVHSRPLFCTLNAPRQSASRGVGLARLRKFDSCLNRDY